MVDAARRISLHSHFGGRSLSLNEYKDEVVHVC
jgi:hypothetical protein